MDELRDRIAKRLKETGKAARKASLDGGLSEYTISKILTKPEHSPTLETITKVARGLDTSPAWIAYGIAQHPSSAQATTNDGMFLINVDLLRQALAFVLQHEGVDANRASLLADILPEALSGPPVDAVARDPFLSFQVHLQLEEQRYDHPAF